MKDEREMLSLPEDVKEFVLENPSSATAAALYYEGCTPTEVTATCRKEKKMIRENFGTPVFAESRW